MGLLKAHLKNQVLFKRALDIGAGEGWITQFLPAIDRHGIELSDVAASRFPGHILRVHEPDGQYDLVVATGVLYKHYNNKQMLSWINAAATNIVLTCHIEDWETDAVLDIKGRQIFEARFPYREFTQKLRIFDASK